MKLKIKMEITLDVPVGTKIIRNDDWLTLVRRDHELYKVVTLHIDDAGGYDFNCEDNWTEYNRIGIEKLLTL